MADPLATILQLVADGRLSAEEAGPLIDALDGSAHAAAASGPAGDPVSSPADGPGRAIRVEVTEGGRRIVNLRVPLSLGQAALARIPGLSEATADRIRDAIQAGIRGPIVAVDEGAGDCVRVVIE